MPIHDLIAKLCYRADFDIDFYDYFTVLQKVMNIHKIMLWRVMCE